MPALNNKDAIRPQLPAMERFHLGKIEFDGFYEEFSSPIFSFLNGLLLSKEDAEDIVQDTFVKLWNNRERLSSALHVKHWLYQVAKHSAIDLLKAVQKADSKRIELIEALDDPNYCEMEIMGSEWMHWIRQELDRLPPGESAVLKGLYIDGLTMQEIASARGTSLKTVHNQRYDGLTKLKERLAPGQYLGILLFFEGIKAL